MPISLVDKMIQTADEIPEEQAEQVAEEVQVILDRLGDHNDGMVNNIIQVLSVRLWASDFHRYRM